MPEIVPIDEVKDQKQSNCGQRTRQPAVAQSPGKRHAFEVAEKKRRAHRSETATDITDEKNEKRGVQTGVAIFVGTQPRPDEKHRRAGGAEKAPGHGGEKQKQAIEQGRRFAAYVHVNAAGNNEERTD